MSKDAVVMMRVTERDRERIRRIAGPGRMSAWIRHATRCALERAERRELIELGIEDAQRDYDEDALAGRERTVVAPI